MTAPARTTRPEEDTTSALRIDMGLVQEIPGFNSRKTMDDEAIRMLATNIEQSTQLMPIMVLAFDNLSEEERTQCQVKKGKRFGLVVGHRRHAAIDSLGWSSIDAKILPSSINLQNAKVLNLIENVQREDLSTYETAQSCLDLHERYGMTQGQIASSLGKSKSYVGNLVRCAAKLAPEILGYWEAKDPMAIVDYLVILAKLDHDTQRARWAEKKGLGAGGPNEESGEGEEGDSDDPPAQTPRRRPSPKRIQALTDWIKENAPDAELQRFAVSLIKICQGEQSTLTIPTGKGKRKPKFDIRKPPKTETEEPS